MSWEKSWGAGATLELKPYEERRFTGVWLMPGKATDNAVIAAFNARLRQECLNQHWFLSLDEAWAKLEQWREMYNHERPHNRLGYRTPEEFAETQQNGAEIQGQFSQNVAKAAT